MTREEAIAHGKEQLEVFGGEHAEFIKLAIEALEQEPCEDAVSREYILDKIHSEDDMEKIENSNLFALHYANLVKNAPSVTPKGVTVTDFADKCRECGARYGRLLNQKWIPVSERLPEENGGYLVTVKQGYVTPAFWMGITKYWNQVIAWMPLPEPYKAEMESEE